MVVVVVVGGIHFAVGSIVGVGGKHYWLGHPSGVAESLGEGQQRPLDLVVLHGAVLAEQVVRPVHSVVLEGVEEAQLQEFASNLSFHHPL